MHEVLVNRLGGLSLPRKSVVRLTDSPDMTLDVCRGRKQQHNKKFFVLSGNSIDTHGIDIKTIQYLIKIKKNRISNHQC